MTPSAPLLVGRVLVVDDNSDIRELLRARLTQQGHTVTEAEHGRAALEKLRTAAFDLMILDITMPEMDGYQVLEQRKDDPVLRNVPVIVVSAVSDLESVVRCIELGADDYLPKPFKNPILRARVQACLERKRFRDQEQAYLRRIEEEQAKSERLLLNILPQAIADRLKDGETTIADYLENVTVVFADLVNFTEFAAHTDPAQLVRALNRIFSAFDRLADTYGLEKIKTIGDAYMAVAGLPGSQSGLVQAAEMALAMQATMGDTSVNGQAAFQLRVGLHTGPAVAGVIGEKKFIYDLWGDTVNIASRLESSGVAAGIQVTANTQASLSDRFRFEPRGAITLKGRGDVQTYLLLGPHGKNGGN